MKIQIKSINQKNWWSPYFTNKLNSLLREMAEVYNEDEIVVTSMESFYFSNELLGKPIEDKHRGL